MRSIPVTKKGVYFAFRDQGACISLLAIRVYYITCPEVTASFAAFPATPTGRELTSIEQSNGVCVANAIEDAPPKYLCKGDGNWYLQGGGCLCKPGYEANVEKQTCNGKGLFDILFYKCHLASVVQRQREKQARQPSVIESKGAPPSKPNRIEKGENVFSVSEEFPS